MEKFLIARFQETLELEAGDVQTRHFLHDKITAESAVIVNSSGTFHRDVTFDTVVSDGAVQVIVTNTGNDSFSLTYNVTVL
ncbi:MAG: hypothetical protein K2O42_00510 [Oscillospiraceae bacterium]|nr:hypothetical protein [Oscillospiraceae bacterium]